MCIIGNPPYAGHSSNKGSWISGLIERYKTSPELQRPAQAKWLSDDYVKFIRMSEHLIEKNSGGGVLAFITNHGYLDNPTFFDMRRSLSKTFDKIEVYDLHGNSKKKEISPDGSADSNVFDIQQGVAIIIAVRNPINQAKTSLKHLDLWGDRESKYQWLWSNDRVSAGAMDIAPAEPLWRWKPTDKELSAVYRQGFSVAALFSKNGRPAPGIVTTHDQFAISMSKSEMEDKVKRLISTEDEREARPDIQAVLDVSVELRVCSRTTIKRRLEEICGPNLLSSV